MKVLIFTLFASLAISGVFGGEKEDAINEIETRYKAVFRYAHMVVFKIEKEMNKTDSHSLETTGHHLKDVSDITLTEFAAEVKKVSRTAVAKGKPVSAFQCLAQVSLDGRQQILAAERNMANRLEQLVPERQKRLYVTEVAAALVLNAVTELKNQTVDEIRSSKLGITSLKKDGLNKIEAGNKQLQVIEKGIEKPTITEEYNSLRTEIDDKFSGIKDTLYRKLQKCIS